MRDRYGRCSHPGKCVNGRQTDEYWCSVRSASYGEVIRPFVKLRFGFIFFGRSQRRGRILSCVTRFAQAEIGDKSGDVGQSLSSLNTSIEATLCPTYCDFHRVSEKGIRALWGRVSPRPGPPRGAAARMKECCRQPAKPVTRGAGSAGPAPRRAPGAGQARHQAVGL